MNRALLFASGCLVTAIIYALIDPPCGLAAWLAGFVCACLVLMVTLFVNRVLELK